MSFSQDSLSSWSVVAGCFIIFFTNYGIMQVTGLLFTESLLYYGENREVTSLPFALSAVSRGVTAPLSGYLSYKMGYRTVVMLGSIIASTSIGAIFFTNDIRVVTVLWSIHGVGSGLATSLLNHIIILCFTKHMTKANGIAVAGASVAGIILPLISVSLIENYGVPGVYLNLGAILLHSIFGTLLLKTPDSDNTNPVDSKTHSNIQSTKVMNAESEGNLSNISNFNRHDSYSCHFKKEHDLPAGYRIARSESNCDDNSKSEFAEEKSDEICTKEHISFYNQTEKNTPELSQTILEDSKTIVENAYIKMSTITSDTADNFCENVHEIEITSKQCSMPADHIDLPNKTEPSGCIRIWSVFWDQAFLIIAFPISFKVCLNIILPSIMLDYAKDIGVPYYYLPQLLMICSMADLASKVGLGWIIDCHYMSRSRNVALWFSVLAISFGLMLLSTGFVLMATAVGLAGVATGIVSAAYPGIVAQFIEKDKRAMAMASRNIFFIPMSFSMSPLIGYFRDDIGSYNGLLYIFVVTSLFCTALLLALPIVSNWNEKSTTNSVMKNEK